MSRQEEVREVVEGGSGSCKGAEGEARMEKARGHRVTRTAATTTTINEGERVGGE